MATVTANVSFNMEAHFDYMVDTSDDGGNVIQETATQIKIVLPDTSVISWTGNFTYDDEEDHGLVGGTITGMTLRDAENAVLLTATGLNVSVPLVLSDYIDEAEILNLGDLLAYSLRSADTITGSSDVDRLLGFNGNDAINGGNGSDTLFGGAGSDTIHGNGLNDFIFGEGGNDQLFGDSGQDFLYGGGGADSLNGGAGADFMTGDNGGDTYYVNDAADVVNEGEDGGNDTVRSSVNYVLGTYVEKLVLTGTGAINGTGNDLANAMTGNSAANILDGGLGNDTLAGGGGNDTYLVDSATDTITEGAGQGTDTVASSAATFVLATNVENLTIIATGDANGTGNASANNITGNGFVNTLLGLDGNDDIDGLDGNDVIRGGNGDDSLIGGAGDDELHGDAGTDEMIGGSGNDEYWLNLAGDEIIEEAYGGTDTIYASFTVALSGHANVENIILTGSGNINVTGNSESNDLTGNGGNNTLTGGGNGDLMLGKNGNDTLLGGSGDDNMNGGGGADTINGGAGFDTMGGGAGADSFIFNTELESDPNNSVIDFESGSDTLVLDKTIFTALTLGTPGNGAFVAAVGMPEAGDANDRILYDMGTGNLYYDADGNGSEFAPIQFANISGGPDLLASDIEIVA